MTKDSHPSGTDRCGEIAANFEDVDVVINIQGDEPLVDFRQLDALIKAFNDQDVQIATLGIRDIDMEAILNPNRIKVVVNNENQALYFSRSPIPNFAHSKENPLTQYPYLRLAFQSCLATY